MLPRNGPRRRGGVHGHGENAHDDGGRVTRRARRTRWSLGEIAGGPMHSLRRLGPEQMG